LIEKLKPKNCKGWQRFIIMEDRDITNIQILVVEDERIVAQDIRNSLTALGYSVAGVAYSGVEAIAMAKKMRPDLVLMDIMLKGEIDGIQAYEQICNHIDIPIIYLTAYADEKTIQRAKLTTPFGYILKPFEDKELHTAIELALYKHKIDKELNETRKWLATVLQSIGDAVIATDYKGLVTFMNPVAEDLTGWSRIEAKDRPISEVFKIINEQTRMPCENPVNKVIESGIIVGLANHTALVSKDGTERIISDSGAPIIDKNNKIVGVVLVFRDITEQSRIEEELVKAQKLEAMGTLAGGIAHDFNNILTGILGNISLAKLHAGVNKDITKWLEDAEKASFRAKELALQLLTFAKGGAPVKKTVWIKSLIEDSAGFAISGSNVRCKFSIPDDLWPVEIDEGQISQVINNLVINADQAMPEGGLIEIQAENIKQAPLTRQGMYIKISIKDHGHGIAKKHLKKIFDPYFTTKQKGSGLGLTSAFSIIKNHDGYIFLESTLSVGTVVDIFLPASEKEVIIKKKLNEKPIPGKGKIMVMDDDELVRDVVGHMLESLGYTPLFVQDGAQAITAYHESIQSGERFKAVIIDLTIPGGMGGEKAIKQLLKIDPDVKAIVSSGYSDDPIMANFKTYGFSGVIAKPYKLIDLSKALQYVIKD